jgi:aminoglycoside 6'-N-acetyltransferase
VVEDVASDPAARPSLAGSLSRLMPVGREHVAPLRRIREHRAVRRWWRAIDPASTWPLGDPDVLRYAVVVGEQVVGLVQCSEENDPDYRHAALDVFLDPGVHGRGLGRDTVAILASPLVDDRGHHRLVIDPAADNTAAIRCHAAVGFRPAVGCCADTSGTTTARGGTTAC